MKTAIGGFAAGVMAVMAVLAAADDRKPADPAAGAKADDAVWLEGEIVDLTSYLKDGSKGKEHWKEAKAYVKGGTPAAMITFDGKLYVVTPYNREGFEPLNNVGEQVRVKASVYERDGVRCIVAKDVKKLPPDYKPGDDGGDRGGHAGGAKDAGAKGGK